MKSSRATSWKRNPLISNNIKLFELLKTGTAAEQRGTIKGYFDIKPNIYYAAGEKSKAKERWLR